MATERISSAPFFFPEGGLLRNDSSAKFRLGSLAFDVFGNAYRYVKANEALSAGDVVTHVAKAAWDSGVTNGAVSSGDTQFDADGFGSSKTLNEYAGYYVSQATAASKGYGYRISGHSAGTSITVYLEDAVAEAIADGTALYIFNPYVVEKVDASTENIRGVAICTIDSGNYGFIQVGGHCRRVKVGHSTSAAIVLNEPLVPVGSGNEGAVQGFAGNTEADILEAANSPLIALQAVGANTTGFVEAIFSRIV